MLSNENTPSFRLKIFLFSNGHVSESVNMCTPSLKAFNYLCDSIPTIEERREKRVLSNLTKHRIRTLQVLGSIQPSPCPGHGVQEVRSQAKIEKSTCYKYYPWLLQMYENNGRAEIRIRRVRR